MPRKRGKAKLIYVIVGHGRQTPTRRDISVRLAAGTQQAEILGVQARAGGGMVAYAQRSDRLGRLIAGWLRGENDDFN